MITRTAWGYFYADSTLTVGATEWADLVRLLKKFGIEVVVTKQQEV